MKNFKCNRNTYNMKYPLLLTLQMMTREGFKCFVQRNLILGYKRFYS